MTSDLDIDLRALARARTPLRRARVEIHAHALVRRLGAQREDQADELQQHEAHDAAVDDRRADGDRLDHRAAPGLPNSRPSATPFSAFCANTPVSSAPTVPPTPCAATTSSESSSDGLRAPRAARSSSGTAAMRAERDRAHRPDEAGRRRDRDQADDDRRGGADRGRLLLTGSRRAASRRPASPAGASIVVVKASAGDAVGRERAAGVEAEPAEPQQAGAEQRERHVVRQQRRRLDSRGACPTHQRGDQRGDAGVDVHDRAAGEVERAHLREPAAAPHPVRDRAVDDERPQRDEHHVGREAHALDDRAGDQRRRDDRERALVAHEQQVRNRALRLRGRRRAGTARDSVADPVVAGRERQRVADRPPRATPTNPSEMKLIIIVLSAFFERTSPP